ncbi:Nuclear fragile X mental retardation-interacting protein 1 [Tupaia chinensis]|uniref:Nuclear fragile X mental retardation-interacting protein 1 n=1 Tax=Tupaia chinensis TaxID=246437 RepID=L8Y583_TUPCH|nr:Nuclear fragile X mental retardation-interacting protein 1 [Tupaia chinensis]
MAEPASDFVSPRGWLPAPEPTPMHAPGMKKIKLDTPEEIARWREERRKNYPTLANIERKKKLKLEKEKRGAVLTTTQYGKMKGMSRHSQMAKIRSPGKHHKWKNDSAKQRVITGSGDHLGDSKPGDLPEANADPLSVLINSESETPIKTEADVLAENQVLHSITLKSPNQDVKATVRNFSEAKCENQNKSFKKTNPKRRKDYHSYSTLFEPRTHHPYLLEMLKKRLLPALLFPQPITASGGQMKLLHCVTSEPGRQRNWSYAVSRSWTD